MLKIVSATLVAAAAITAASPFAGASAETETLFPALTLPYNLDRTIAVPQITESSGLARSTYARSVLWTHNDSGDTARIFAVDTDGRKKAVLRMSGVTQIDFEAISAGPNNKLWVGDIGDDTASRSTVQVYRLKEPLTLADATVTSTRFTLRFPDGPRNAEALMVHPVTGRLYVVSKGRVGGAIYVAPSTLSTTTTNVLTKVAAAPAQVSDGTFTPDGEEFLLTNDSHIYTYTDFGIAPTAIVKPPLEAGESMEVTRNGARIMVGSEGKSSVIYSIAKPVETGFGTRAGVRDPLLWPYPSRSIWNHPIGSDAVMVPLGMKAPTARTVAVEDDILIIAPNAPQRPILEHNAGWSRTMSRCGSLTGRTLKTGVPIPGGWTTDPGFYGLTPNHSAAIVMPDLTLYETQPLHVCPDGKVVSQYAASRWQGNSILTGGMPENLGEGSHGGSFMTAFGGTIRLGEWVPGGEIPHVMKIEVDSTKHLWGGTGDKFRWPARVADANSAHYGGTVPAARMGALLALPKSFPVASLTSEPARIMAKAMQGYGAYIVDETGRDTVAFATEWGPQGRVTTEFKNTWGFPLDGHVTQATGAHLAYLKDMEKIYTSLAVVNDNSPTNVGGAGTRMAPWAAPLK